MSIQIFKCFLLFMLHHLLKLPHFVFLGTAADYLHPETLLQIVLYAQTQFRVVPRKDATGNVSVFHICFCLLNWNLHVRFLASPRHSSNNLSSSNSGATRQRWCEHHSALTASSLGSALGSHINWKLSDWWLRLGIAQTSWLSPTGRRAKPSVLLSART